MYFTNSSQTHHQIYLDNLALKYMNLKDKFLHFQAMNNNQSFNFNIMRAMNKLKKGSIR